MEYQWRDVPGFEGFYKVSNYGEVCSVDRTLSNGRRYKGRMRKLGDINGGLMIGLNVEGEQFQRSVPRLVWEAFVGPVPEGDYITFKDGNFRNCRLDNLMLESEHEHMRFMEEIRQGNYLWFVGIEDEIIRLYADHTAAEIAQHFGTTQTAVEHFLSRRNISKAHAHAMKTSFT